MEGLSTSRSCRPIGGPFGALALENAAGGVVALINKALVDEKTTAQGDILAEGRCLKVTLVREGKALVFLDLHNHGLSAAGSACVRTEMQSHIERASVGDEVSFNAVMMGDWNVPAAGEAPTWLPSRPPQFRAAEDSRGDRNQ